MNGGITKSGNLFIERPIPSMKDAKIKTKKFSMNCPHIDTLCGDKCPHFSEPIKVQGRYVRVEICYGKKLDFDKFEDKRKNAE